jgi:hypothetical protein
MSTDFVISFDTTGSMYPCLTEVRERVAELVQRLFSQNPDARISIAAHGDYCDARSTYVMVNTPFKDVSEKQVLIDFAKNVKKTNGGDGPECYELVLFNVGNMHWQADNKVFIIFADAVPHDARETQNYLGLDWRTEAKKLGEKGVNIYSIQCLDYGRDADFFYDNIARVTNGYHLRLHQFNNAVEAILAISSKQVGELEAYHKELEDEFRMNRGLSEIFKSLGSKKVTDTKFTIKTAGLIPVSPTRFQILTVPYDVDIMSFVKSTGAEFRKGRGFYQFTKRETIQENKEVVLRDKLTGDMFTGPEARIMIGLPYGERGDISPKYFEQYEVYVQSTSSNRKLIGRTKFLYEVV